MALYLTVFTRFFKSRASRSYPKLRYDFRPPAYVVLTREIRAGRSERHG